MKLIKHVTLALAMTFTTAAMAGEPNSSEGRRSTYAKNYVLMCESQADLAGTMTQARYSGYPLSKIMAKIIADNKDLTLQDVAMYVYQRPYMASEAGRHMQEQQIKSTVFTECMKGMGE